MKGRKEGKKRAKEGGRNKEHNVTSKSYNKIKPQISAVTFLGFHCSFDLLV